MISASIIIPTYNEINGLSTILKKIDDYLSKNKNTNMEFIFVDDGSDVPIIDKIPLNKNIKILRNEKNSGYGFSIKMAAKEAKNEILAIIDADDSYDLNFLIEKIEKYDTEVDLLVGKRNFLYDEGLVRKTYRFMLNKISSVLCNYLIRDLNSGLRIFKKNFFLENLKYFPDGFSLTSTQTLTYVLQNKKIVYEETSYSKRSGKSKINLFKDPFNFIFLILKVYVLISPLSFFSWTGVFFISLSSRLGVITYIIFESIADISVLLLFLTGINFILFGLIAESIRLKK